VSVNQTALFGSHQRLGAQLVEFAHTLLPVRYTSEKEEHLAVRHAIGMFDVSHMGEFLISGPQAPEFLNNLLTNNINLLKPNHAQYTLMLNNQAGINDDLILYYFGDNRYMLCVNANNILQDYQHITKQAQNISGLILDNASKLFSQIALQGPRTYEFLKTLTSEELPDFFGIKEMLIDNIACLIARTGYTGEDGFEIFLSNAGAEQLWDYLLAKGQAFGLKPCGLAARDSLRLEAGMRLHGIDMDESTTPLEAGLMFAVDLDKNFIGRDFLLEQIKIGPKKILTGFKLLDRGIARHGFKIFSPVSDDIIGEVTSGTWPCTQEHAIGLAYVEPAYKIGHDISIDIRGKRVRAITCKTRFLANHL